MVKSCDEVDCPFLILLPVKRGFFLLTVAESCRAVNKYKYI